MGRKDRKHQGAGAGRQGGAGAGSRADVHEGGEEEEEEQQLPWQDIGDDEVCVCKQTFYPHSLPPPLLILLSFSLLSLLSLHFVVLLTD